MFHGTAVAIVVQPGPQMMPGSFEELVANGAKAGALKVTLALFDLFCAAVSENSIVEQVCVESLWPVWRLVAGKHAMCSQFGGVQLRYIIELITDMI
jgi:hypothetical protein